MIHRFHEDMPLIHSFFQLLSALSVLGAKFCGPLQSIDVWEWKVIWIIIRNYRLS